MTKGEKEGIISMRKSNLSYAEISEKTGFSVSAIKTFCHRQGLTATTHKPGVNCKNCGKLITKKSKQRPRLFCSDQCKQTWWNKHRKERNSSSIVPHVCATCGKTFNDYSGANRKYCSQACFRERNKHDGE